MPSSLLGRADPAVRQAVARTLEVLPVPAFAARADGTLWMANRAASASLLQGDPGAGLPRFAAGACDLDTDAQWRAGIAGGRTFTLALPDGRKLHAAPVLDLGHDGRGWLVVQESRNAPCAADAPLADAHHLAPALNTALQAGRMGLWEWDQATDTAYWNPQLYDILRLPRGSGIEPADRFLGLIEPEDRPKLDDILQRLHRNGEFPPVRLRLRVGDGSVRWLMSCGQVARNGSKAPVVVGVNVDVTEEVDAQEQLRQARQALQRHQRIIESVLEHVPVGIAVTVNGEHGLRLVSRFGLDMIESGRDKGHQWDAWQVYHLDGLTPARQEDMALSRAARGEVIQHEEWLIRRADGALLPVSCAAGPIRNADGTITGGIVAWYDITPFKAAEAERRKALAMERQARDAAEEANRQKDLFVGIVSHELRTPLSAILGWTRVLHKQPSPGTSHKGIQAIERNALTLARLVDDLLDVTRIAAGKFELRMLDADFAPVVDAAVQTVQPLADERGVALQWSCPAAVAPVLGDALRLQQAVWNLLTNAVKFSNEGGLVQVSLELGLDQVTLIVTDHGQGIDAAALPRLFERFWQDDAGGSHGRRAGLGLGLAIARHIVQRHGGELEAASPGIGCGATFTLALPTRACPPEASQLPTRTA